MQPIAAAWPKAELHLHLEGSLVPATLFEISRRHGCPCGLDSLAACQALYQYQNFAGFLQAFKTVSQHLLDPEDYALALRGLAQDLKRQNVVYAEITLSIGVLHWKKQAVAPVLEALEAERQALHNQNLRLAWIFDAVRQFGVAAAEKVLSDALYWRERAPVVAIGIGGDEIQGPAVWFESLYARAAANGLHLTAHAGENAGADSVWQTLRYLHPERIGHGLRAREDQKLIQYLAAHGAGNAGKQTESPIWLEICPTSNVRTQCLLRLADHPLPRFWQAGLALTLASDDPAMFETDLNQEFSQAAALGLSPEDCRQLARNGFLAAFLPEPDRAAYLNLFDSRSPQASGK